METAPLGLGARLLLALVLPWKLLFDGLFAARVQAAAQPALPPPVPEPPKRPALTTADPTAALQLLALFQREGRLVDFLTDDVTGFSDADVGAAARVVHEGCRKVLKEYVKLAPVRSEADGERVTLPAGFDAARVRLTGNVVGQPPFVGELAHHGWEVTALTLPSLVEGHDARILAPAEVEL